MPRLGAGANYSKHAAFGAAKGKVTSAPPIPFLRFVNHPVENCLEDICLHRDCQHGFVARAASLYWVVIEPSRDLHHQQAVTPLYSSVFQDLI